MPQLNGLVLLDAHNPAVEVPFTPQGIDGQVAVLVHSTGVPIGDGRLTMQGSRTAQGRVKRTLNLTIPVVQDQVVGGVSKPAVVRTSYCKIEFSFDGSSSTQERADIIRFASGVTYTGGDNVMLKKFLEDLEGLY